MDSKQDWVVLLVILAVLVPMIWFIVHLIRKSSS